MRQAIPRAVALGVAVIVLRTGLVASPPALAAPAPAAAPPPVAAPPPIIAPGQVPPGQVPPNDVDADPLSVELLTFGPGLHPFTRFGHNAIRIIDRRSGSDLVYNFGTFSFDSPLLIVDFLQGRLRYWLSRSSMASTVSMYRRENRDIETQELDLSPAQKRELALRLEVNVRPENREYRYDYFADNCSTRVRDALDAVLDGRLRASAVGPGAMSLRAHALRMAADDLPLYTALLLALGPRSDRPIDEWAEAFLPEMLQRMLRSAQAFRGTPTGQGTPIGPAGAASAGAGAGTGHLVKAERVLFSDDRPPPRREAPSRLPAYLGVGVVAGIVLYLLGRLGGRSSLLRALFGLVLAAAGLVLGGIGCFLVGAWAFTPHTVAYRNENVLLFAPFAIALAVLGFGTAFGARGAMRKSFLLSAAALGLAVAASALKLFPWSRQDNGALILMMLPLWWGLTAGTRAVAAGGRGRPARFSTDE